MEPQDSFGKLPSNTESVRRSQGTINWQRRLWVMVTYYLKERASLPPRSSPDPTDIDEEMEKKIIESRNKTLVTYEENFDFEMNRAIKDLHQLTNICRKFEEREMGTSPAFERAMADIIIMLFPFAPMFAAEMWQGLASAPWHYPQSDAYFDWKKDVWEQKWPRVDDDYDCQIYALLNGVDFARLSFAKRDLGLLSGDNIKAIMESNLLKHDAITSKYGADVESFDDVTLDASRRYSPTVNIIMNSIPMSDSSGLDPSLSTEGKDREQSKKKSKNSVIQIPIKIS